MAYRAGKSGVAAENQQKIRDKYDADAAAQCLAWVQELLRDNGKEADFSTAGDEDNFHNVFKNGLILCRLANVLMLGCIPETKLSKAPTMAFKQMELIGLFVEKIKAYDIADHENFQTVDLHESQNLHQVVICLQSLSRKAQKKGHKGFGPKESEANVREFSEEQLKAGQNVISLQYGSNKGASQAGMNMGNMRHIVD